MSGWDECSRCGHLSSEHFEEPEILYHQTVRDGEVRTTEEANPLYVPLEFHCSHDGCSCMIKYVGKYTL
jgi:hypothetical protein